MAIRALFANLSCADLDRSIDWYARLFGREPDAQPMTGLAEWHLDRRGGLQLFAKPEDAGHGTLTVLVQGLEEERGRVADAGMEPGRIEAANYTRIVRMQDPDGNLVVLAEPID